jgi:hypothetical protein
MASDAAHKFWTSETEYHDIAQTYEQNIETTCPERVTSHGLCDCLELDLFGDCTWASTKVQYYEYRGPDVKHINR